MELVVAVLLLAGVFTFVVGIRPRDLPPPEAASPTQHLEDRKARIYEGLRDLQFEYRVGKLSEADYQRTKLDLQQQLAGVMAEIDKVAPGAAALPEAKPVPDGLSCAACGATFDQPMKFCGKCGKAIA